MQMNLTDGILWLYAVYYYSLYWHRDDRPKFEANDAEVDIITFSGDTTICWTRVHQKPPTIVITNTVFDCDEFDQTTQYNQYKRQAGFVR